MVPLRVAGCRTAPLGSGCDVVQSSRYAQVFGVPVAGLGLGFYGIVLALGILPLERMTRWRLALPTTAAGVAASLGFTVVQYVRIRATCSLCLASAVLALGYLSSRLVGNLHVPPPRRGHGVGLLL